MSDFWGDFDDEEEGRGEDIPSVHCSREINMYVSMFCRAVLDAVYYSTKERNGEKAVENNVAFSKKHSRDANDWFDSMSEDVCSFRWVARLLNLDPEAVLEALEDHKNGGKEIDLEAIRKTFRSGS